MSMNQRIGISRMKVADQKYNHEISESKDDRLIL